MIVAKIHTNVPNLIQLKSVFKDVSAMVIFDVLNDPEYRKKWDVSMVEAYEICQLSPNNDIGYYASMFFFF